MVGYQLSFVTEPTKSGGINEPCRKSSWVISSKALLEVVDSATAVASSIKFACVLAKLESRGDYLFCVEGKGELKIRLWPGGGCVFSKIVQQF